MYKNNPPTRATLGFTLIELMVSMVLSLFLIGGVISIYVSSKHTSQAREELSSVNDNARAAIRVLSQTIGHAGYATPAHIDFDDYIVSTGGVINAGSCADGSSNITDSTLLRDSNDGTTDVITVTALADAASVGGAISKDCSGQVLNVACQYPNAANIDGTKIYNSFFIQTPAGEAEPSLFCNSSVSANSIRMADGVEDMQFQYGVDTTGDLIADKYLTATQVNANGWWQNIVSVQLALLVRSAKNVRNNNEAHTYQLLDKTVNTNDRRQRSVYTTEISLRNVLL